MPSVILTRPTQRLESPDNTFTQTLTTAGIEVFEIPMIQVDFPAETNELDISLERLASGQYEICVLASPTAIDFFHKRVLTLGLYEAISTNTGFATVGARSAEKLTSYGYRIEVPLPHQHAGAAALLTELRTFNMRGRPTLLLQSQIGMVVLQRAFEMVGAEIKRVVLYETTGPTLRDSARLVNLLEGQGPERPDVVAFFSPSAVESFVKTIVQMSSSLRTSLPSLAAIGETTAFEIRALLRLEPAIVARKANQESLAEDIIRFLQPVQ